MSTVSDYFGSLVFDDRVMKAMLSADVYQSLKKTIDEGASLNNDVANAVAAAPRCSVNKAGSARPPPPRDPPSGRLRQTGTPVTSEWVGPGDGARI